ncbi:hypothetical protein [uncultured Salinicola sp.]|uniref:hypothetical protein n=1 Tax=uncultured Salinicola sp. TaxID=1193542 RepID=UPI0026163AA4|nr:hypothetical protein [uncultured Salinicola sp.]|tara:strand:- start:1132 stop:1743 length:612 start_codon:yes stop_codon:yes gene_type:complete
MNPVSEMIDLRWTSLRRRNRSATIQQAVSVVLTICLAMQILSSALIPATLFDTMQTVLATIALMLIWFYSATEKQSAALLARGLAGDLLIGVATANMREPRIIPSTALRTMTGDGIATRATIEISPGHSGTAKVAMRVANKRVSMTTGPRVRETRIPRLSYVPEEYRFTPEDVQDVMTSMASDPHNIIIYRIILDLIESSKDA